PSLPTTPRSPCTTLFRSDGERLFLARARLGVKPLYLSEDSRRLRFASTLPALLQGGDVDSSLDPAALDMYLNFHSVVPAPHTLLDRKSTRLNSSHVKISY